MWIRNTRGSASNLRVPGMPDDADPVDIPESGVAQVNRAVGEALIEHCPTIEEHDPEDDA